MTMTLISQVKGWLMAWSSGSAYGSRDQGKLDRNFSLLVSARKRRLAGVPRLHAIATRNRPVDRLLKTKAALASGEKKRRLANRMTASLLRVGHVPSLTAMKHHLSKPIKMMIIGSENRDIHRKRR